MKKNSHPVKVVEVKDYEGLYANSHPFKVVNEGGGGGGDYDDFTGATASTAGEHGLVPAPKAGEQNKYLKGDGTWAEVQGGGGSGIPTDATFWGQSYDSVNNRVTGDVVLGTNKMRYSASDNYNYILFGNPSYIQLNGPQRSLVFGARQLSQGSWTPGNGIFLGAGAEGIYCNDRNVHNVADPTAAQDAATKNYVDTNIGDLTTLTTTAKTSAVAAINELASQVGSVETALNAINNGSQS